MDMTRLAASNILFLAPLSGVSLGELPKLWLLDIAWGAVPIIATNYHVSNITTSIIVITIIIVVTLQKHELCRVVSFQGRGKLRSALCLSQTGSNPIILIFFCHCLPVLFLSFFFSFPWFCKLLIKIKARPVWLVLHTAKQMTIFPDHSQCFSLSSWIQTSK